jgi:hypothetical protein
MEMKLNIYENKKIIKTYTANDFVLTTGICEDILNIIDIDKLTAGGLNDTALGMEIIKIVAKSFSKFKPFIQDIFEGLTEDEYRKTAIKEVAGVIIIVVKHTVSELYSISGNNSKN